MQINNSNVAQIVKIIKYITLSFIDTYETIPSQQRVPGEFLEFFSIDPVYIQTIGNNKQYSLFYDWVHNNVSMPLLVPNTNTTYTALRCEVLVPNGTINMSVNEYGGQTLDNLFRVICINPLYFTAVTSENNIDKPFAISQSIILDTQTNKYLHNLLFDISDANVVPGTPKQYVVRLSIYKDKLRSKYLGTISFTFELVKTTGTGE